MPTTISISTTDPARLGAIHVDPADPTRMVIEIPDPPTPTPSVPMPPVAPQIGVSVKPEEYGTWYPRLPGVAFARVFAGPGKGLPSWKSQAMMGLPANAIRHVSHKDKLTPSMLASYWDGIPANTHLWHTFRHEPEPDMDPGEFRAYWQQLRQVADDHPKRLQITLVNVHTLWASRHKRGVDWRQWMLPEAADVDGWDCYRDTDFEAYEPAESLLGLPVNAAAEFGLLRWSIPELGATRCTWDLTGEARARWFRDCVRFAGTYGCEAVGLWCSQKTQNGQTYDYRPHDTATLAAWQQVIGASNAARGVA
jgi:hypothetical protein